MKRLLGILLITILLIGCDKDSGDTDTSGVSNTSKIKLNIYAEKLLKEKITAPFTIDWDRTNYKKYPDHAGNGGGFTIDKEKGEFRYRAGYGFIGKDNLSIIIYSKNSNKVLEKKYDINIISPPLEGYRDFMISLQCNYSAGDTATSIDLDIVDNSLGLVVKINDNKNFTGGTFPKYSRIGVDYLGYKDSNSIKHHNYFKSNLDKNVLITCNYPKGSKSLVYPLKNNSGWASIRSHLTGHDSFKFKRNDLYFYVSSLSDLHSKIYLIEYKHTGSSSEALNKANLFMEDKFPKSHYTAETTKQYQTHPSDPVNTSNPFSSLSNWFDDDNKGHYINLETLAKDISEGDVFELIDKIASNYESFYKTNYCIDAPICSLLFPEYTKSVTLNPLFTNQLENWSTSNMVYSVATGSITHIPNKNIASLELRSNIMANTNEPISSIDLYQTEYISSNKFDDYFLRYNIDYILGAADGGNAWTMCVNSSGFTGVYAAFKDINNSTIGLLAWTDHCNKFDFAWSGRNGIDSTDRFYNVRLRNVVRRINPETGKFNYTASLGYLTKKHLPKVYSELNSIRSIAYGVFVTEHRSTSDSCYFCEAKIDLLELNLLMKK